MRLGIKGKQVLGVTIIVGAVVVVLSLMRIAGLAQISLDESRARAEHEVDRACLTDGQRDGGRLRRATRARASHV